MTDKGIEATKNIFVDFPNFTAQENLGKDIFNGKLTPEAIGTCVTCHLPNAVPLHFEQPIPEGANQVIFSGAEPDNIGLDIDINVEDNGVGANLDILSLYGHFKSPSIRNIEVTPSSDAKPTPTPIDGEDTQWASDATASS